jgi:hypothetical protein
MKRFECRTYYTKTNRIFTVWFDVFERALETADVVEWVNYPHKNIAVAQCAFCNNRKRYRKNMICAKRGEKLYILKPENLDILKSQL